MKDMALAAALAAFATLAHAAGDPAANYFGNTLHVMPESGKGTHYIYYNPDHTFSAWFPDGHYGGTYKVMGNKVCLTAVRPGEIREATHCYGFDPARKVGESWTERTVQGVTRFRLDAGRSNKPSFQ